jgi:hypothetical protein
MNENTANNTVNTSANLSVWTARKGDVILAQSDSEKGAWRLLGVRGKKQKAALIAAGFEVQSS